MKDNFKIKKSSIIFIMLITLFTNIYNINGFSKLVNIISIAMLIYGVVKFPIIFKKTYSNKWWPLFLIMVHIISVVYVYFKYGQNILEGLMGIHYIFIAFSYYYFYDLFRRFPNRYEEFIKILTWIATIIAIMQILQCFIPSISIFNVHEIRNERIRIFSSPINIWLVFYYVGQWRIKALRRYQFLQLSIILFTIFYVSQTRAIILTLSITFVIIFYKDYSIKNKLKRYMTFTCLSLILLPFLYILIKNGIFESLFSFLDEIEAGTGSGFTRLASLEYYWNLYCENPILGIGFLKGGSPLALSIYATKTRHFYMEDCGLAATLFKCGLLGLGWILYTFFIMIKNYFILTKIPTKKAHALKINLLMLIIMSVLGVINVDYFIYKENILFYFLFMSWINVYIHNFEKKKGR